MELGWRFQYAPTHRIVHATAPAKYSSAMAAAKARVAGVHARCSEQHGSDFALSYLDRNIPGPESETPSSHNILTAPPVLCRNSATFTVPEEIICPLQSAALPSK